VKSRGGARPLNIMDKSQAGGSPSLLSQTKAMLRRFRLRAKKGLGQNFLIDGEVLETIVTAAGLTPADTVIEVGPGLGILTAELAKRAGWVIAIELDNRLADILTKTLPYDNIVILNEDVLGTEPSALLQGHAPPFPSALSSYKVVANLPYYITSPVLRHFLEAPIKPETIVVMVQREVAEAIIAGAGQRSMLSISVQFYGKPTIVTQVPAASFFPAPEVDSAVVKIEVYRQPPVDVANAEGFFQLVRAGFTANRKQISNSLSQGLGLPKSEVTGMLDEAGIDSRRRAETLNLEEWAGLWRIYNRVVK
jgi:16S rRNA (adenine1518-N6/adenine1519-N6)-dimethyltransferase